MTSGRRGPPRPPDTATSTTRTGALAEAAGLRFLQAQGLRLLARNYRCRCGELDLVMLDGEQLVMVEIRYRQRIDPVHPALTVTATKRRRLVQAAQRWLQDHPGAADRSLRFDVLAMTGPLNAPRCDWLRNAFTGDDVGRWS